MDKEDVLHTHTQTTQTHTVKQYSAIKKNENVPFAATCMDLEGIVLSEINQTEVDKYRKTSRICGL